MATTRARASHVSVVSVRRRELNRHLPIPPELREPPFPSHCRLPRGRHHSGHRPAAAGMVARQPPVLRDPPLPDTRYLHGHTRVDAEQRLRQRVDAEQRLHPRLPCRANRRAMRGETGLLAQVVSSK